VTLSIFHIPVKSCFSRAIFTSFAIDDDEDDNSYVYLGAPFLVCIYDFFNVTW
jgi:hypothetical protein